MGRGEHPRKNHHKKISVKLYALSFKQCLQLGACSLLLQLNQHIGVVRKVSKKKKIKAYGQLVLLGFDVTIFTPVAYQRHSL